MAPKVCVTKLKKEMKVFLSSPPPHIPAIFVNERNMLEWHFLLEGPPDTPYAEGWYIGKLRFPPEYPFKPPSIMMLTPSGRFATGTRLCLSMSDFHPESWNPMWTVASILTGLLSFMLESQITTGSLNTTDEEKREFAAKSLTYNLEHPQLKQMFQQELQAARDRPSQPPSSLPQSEQSQSADTAASRSDACQAASQAAGIDTSQAATAASDIEGRLAQAAITDEPTRSSANLAMPAAMQEAAMDLMQKQVVNGHLEAALVQVEATLRNHEKDAEFCHRLNLLKAQTVARAGDLKAALAVLHPLTKPLASNPADLTRLYTSWQVASDHKDRGNQFFKEGNLQGALEQYQQALAAEPSCAAVLCNIATTLSKLDRSAEAIEAATAALVINRDYEKAKQRLAQAQQCSLMDC